LRDHHKVVANVKDGALRLSMSFFNNEEDLERAVHAISRELSGKPTDRASRGGTGAPSLLGDVTPGDARSGRHE
jgi:hypothetical protein